MEIKSLPLLFAAAIGLVLFASLLVWVVTALLRSRRKQFIATGPLVEEQVLEIAEALPLLLMVEVPRFGSNFRDFRFDVIEEATGETTSLSYSFVRAQGTVYRVTTMQLPIGRFEISRPGTYRVRISGLEPTRDYSGSRVMLSRPYLARLVLQIIGIVISAVGLLLSLVLGLLQILPVETT